MHWHSCAGIPYNDRPLTAAEVSRWQSGCCYNGSRLSRVSSNSTICALSVADTAAYDHSGFASGQKKVSPDRAGQNDIKFGDLASCRPLNSNLGRDCCSQVSIRYYHQLSNELFCHERPLSFVKSR